MSDVEATNFFRDRSVHDDPYPYFDRIRELSPVWQEPHYGVYMVTGYDEALAVYNDATNFSSCNTVSGPFTKFPVPLEGDDISEIIEQYRDDAAVQRPAAVVRPAEAHGPPRADDAAPHARAAQGQRGVHVATRRPPARRVRRPRPSASSSASTPGPSPCWSSPTSRACPSPTTGLFRSTTLDAARGDVEHKPLEFLYEQFTAYIEDRRRTPRDDIMTAMATATFPDGSTPEVNDVALIAANLFAGGQETTVRLLSFALRIIGERPDIQEQLRQDRDRIPNFIEETLRLESPLRAQFRMARRPTTVAGVDIPAGSTVMLLPGAANRDPRMFADPAEFDIDRANARYHVAFGHGIHHCAGAAPGPGRGSGHHQPAPRPHRRHRDLRARSTARPAPGATSTSRPTSSAA